MISLPENDDLNQEAAIAAWLAGESHDGRVPLDKWQAVKANRARLEYYRFWRQRRKHAGYCVELSLIQIERLSVQEPAKYEPRLMRALASLAPQYQRLIHLRYWQGFTPAEIETITGIASSVVSNALDYTHKQLRRLLCITPAFSRPSSRSTYWQPPACLPPSPVTLSR